MVKSQCDLVKRMLCSIQLLLSSQSLSTGTQECDWTE